MSFNGLLDAVLLFQPELCVSILCTRFVVKPVYNNWSFSLKRM